MSYARGQYQYVIESLGASRVRETKIANWIGVIYWIARPFAAAAQFQNLDKMQYGTA